MQYVCKATQIAFQMVHNFDSFALAVHAGAAAEHVGAQVLHQ